jgi:hypothetical protein
MRNSYLSIAFAGFQIVGFGMARVLPVGCVQRDRIRAQ